MEKQWTLQKKFLFLNSKLFTQLARPVLYVFFSSTGYRQEALPRSFTSIHSSKSKAEDIFQIQARQRSFFFIFRAIKANNKV